jgi:hypothetical protein
LVECCSQILCQLIVTLPRTATTAAKEGNFQPLGLRAEYLCEPFPNLVETLLAVACILPLSQIVFHDRRIFKDLFCRLEALLQHLREILLPSESALEAIVRTAERLSCAAISFWEVAAARIVAIGISDF